jgi:3-hydroxyisobutyrate dehydrogenase
MDKNVGIVGIGIMGTAMARNLCQAGFNVVGYDPVPEARARLKDLGGRALTSPRGVAEAASIIIMSLPKAEALIDVIGGAEGVAQAAGTGQIVVECSTLPMDTKQAAFDEMEKHGKILLDCPISGTGAQAVNKDLVILGSGDKDAFERCAAVFAGMSRVQHYLGPFGRGSVMKYIANHLVTIHNVAAAEAMVLGIKAGIDPALVYDTLADSAGTSRMFQMRGPLMRDESYDAPTATIRMQLKDIAIIDAFADSLDCALPVYAAASQIYQAGAALGRREQDTAAVCAVLETMHGIDRKKPAS